MLVPFYKYQGTGNDFVIIDNRSLFFDKNNTKLVEKLCNRKFGIGADGLILLENDDVSDFRMIYFNSDGNESSMCGNGGRCVVAFARMLGLIKNETTFKAIDGEHYARIQGDLVSLQMQNVAMIETGEGYVFLNTGSPHHVQFESQLNTIDVKKEGAALRYTKYSEEGSNVNFAEKISDDIFAVRTYERGVEDETLSCGTGVTAVAIAANKLGKTDANKIKLKTPGGELTVTFERQNNIYENVFLTGSATYVYKGEIVC
ncbi:diaminopimelate epimerase [Leptobacterium sp. I13]|uniref:diaminopimelate epimerase n=1 Tax=Leptobacterium meishanense TaxID=3128904 RepID=UPI0030EBDFAE